uniref:Putative ovule protein n=1 Tax=Solanum chacoense TaxID=4108 RepID=A0A0V0GXL7_SOLCH
MMLLVTFVHCKYISSCYYFHIVENQNLRYQSIRTYDNNTPTIIPQVGCGEIGCTQTLSLPLWGPVNKDMPLRIPFVLFDTY